MTPKPTGTTRLVTVSNSTRAGTRRAGEAEAGGAPLVGDRLGPALQRLAGERNREHVQVVALGEGAEQRAEDLAARAAGMAQIDQPVALAEAGQYAASRSTRRWSDQTCLASAPTGRLSV